MSSYNHFGCSCCGGPFNGGNCPGCSSVGSGDESVYDSNPYSYNDTPNFINQPPQHQYETYSCEFYEGNPHPGFDCQTGNTPVFDQGPYYNQDFGFNQPPFYSPSQTHQFNCFEFCGGPHYSNDCQAGNMPFYDQGPCYNQNYSDDQPPFYSSYQQPQFDCCEGSDDYTELTYDNEQCLSDHYTAPVTPPTYTPSIPFLATMEPTDTLLMGDEVISTSRKGKLTIHKGLSVYDLLPNPRESDGDIR
ncbi:hypothetical protein Tco_0410928 [Tanacetum coccineum]